MGTVRSNAADYSWNATGTNSWSTAGDWSPSGPPGAGDTADFVQRILPTQTGVTVTSATAGAINIGGNLAYVITGGTITMNNGASDSVITETGSAAGNDTISSNIQVAGDGNLDIVNDRNVGLLFTSGTISGVSGGTTLLTVTNTGGGIVDMGVLNSNGGTLNVSLNSGTSGIIALISSGANFTGSLTIVSGTVSLAGGSGLGNTGTATIDSGGVLSLNGKTGVSKGLVINGSGINGGGAIVNTTGTATFSGAETLASDSTLSISSGAGITFNSSITGAGGLILTGAGTLLLSGADSYTGGTTINSGTLQISISTALGATTNALAVNGGTLDINGKSITVGALSGTGVGTITNSNAAAAILTTSFGSGTSASYNGAISNGTGTVALTKSGAGTQVLTGSSGYTGVTTISSGTLQLGDGTSGHDGAISNASLITDAGALVYDTFAAQSYGGSISGAGIVAKLGSGTLTLSGSNPYSGSTALNGGVLNVGSLNALGAATSITGTTAVTAGNTIAFNSGTLQYSVANQVDYSSRIAGSSGAISIDTNGQNATFASDLASSNTGGLTKLGSGTLTLSGNNSYSGNTTVAAGTLLLSGGGNFTNSGTIRVTSLATLDISAVTSSTFTIGTGQTLGGAGTVNTGIKTLNVAGFLTPGLGGTAAQTLGVSGNLNLASTGSTTLQLYSGSNDSVSVTASLSYGGTLAVIGSMDAGTYNLFTLGGAVAGDFSSVTVGGFALTASSPGTPVDTWSGISGNTSYSFSDSDGDLTIAAVPEPSVWMLCAGGGGILLGLKYLRRPGRCL